MNDITGWLIAIVIISLYFAILLFLKKRDLFERYNLSFYGPLLMWKTKKGKEFIRKIAKPKKFWNGFAMIGIVISFIAMFFMLWLLVENLSLLQHVPKKELQNLPGINMVIALPGINPILPVGYTIIGLAIAIVVHEFSHGIQCVLGKIKIKSLGIIAFIVPIGAFVEPDEDELKNADSKRRMKVFAAGPTMNLFVSFLCVIMVSFVLFPSVQPSDGAVVFYVIEDSPAHEIGMKSWQVITEIDGREIKDYNDFYSVMHNTTAGENISISYHSLDGKYYTKYVVLADKYNFTNESKDAGIGFLGVGITDVLERDLELFKNPFEESPKDFLIRYYGAPFMGFFIGYSPLKEPFTSYYKIEGVFSFLPSDVFWGIVNTFYWIFWLNFAVGLFNVLPIIPFDGGYILQDGIKEGIKRLTGKITEERREKIVKVIMTAISIMTLFLVLAPLILKYLAMLLFS